MNAIPEDLQSLIDDYLSGQIDEPRLAQLEATLLEDPEARRRFVCYCDLETQLHLEMRARRAADKALRLIDGLSQSTFGEGERGVVPSVSSQRPPRRPIRSRRAWRIGVSAAVLFVAALIGVSWWSAQARWAPEVAWLANAQNCRWADETVPAGDLHAGRTVALKSGLAELHFRSGASVILEGPARLQLVSGSVARLLQGKLTAHVPEQAKGFQVFSPQGKVVDLGTEFGMEVGDRGGAEVVVFSGKVEAYGRGGRADTVSLSERQVARIDSKGVSRESQKNGAQAAGFVRVITPSPVIVPRTLVLDFRRPVAGTLRDRAGRGTGLTHRLPGTGRLLEPNDTNLLLAPDGERLQLTTTNSDVNTQYLLDRGEYLGVRLSDVGFTGREDFEVSVSIPDIPSLRQLGQFGLYAGTCSDQNIRGGLISRREPGQYTQFLVNNHGGRDSDAHYLGVTPSGDDLEITLRRIGGRYSLTVDDRTAASTSALTIRHPAFLDSATDLFVGIFGANTQSTTSKTLVIKKLKVCVQTVASP